jgi:hypothetical protein
VSLALTKGEYSHGKQRFPKTAGKKEQTEAVSKRKKRKKERKIQ